MAVSCKLLVYPRPKPDESYRGYIWRLSLANGWKKPGRMLKLYQGLGYTEVEDSLLQENLSGSDYQHLKAKKDRCDNQYLVRRSYRVCPECYKNEPYHREIWDYALIPYCLSHKTSLVDAGFELNIDHEEDNQKAKQFLDEASEDLCKLLSYQLGFSQYPPDGLGAFAHLSASDMQRITVMIGAYQANSERYQPRKEPFKKNISSAIGMIDHAAKTFHDWPNNLIRIIPKVDRSSICNRRLQSSQTYLYTAINKELASKQFVFFRNEYRQLLAEQWPEVIYRKTSWLNTHKQRNNYMSGTSFAKKNSVSLHSVVQQIQSGMIEGNIRKLSNGRRQITVRKDQEVFEENLYTLKEAANLLGVTDTVLRSLIELGHFQGYKVNASTAWNIPPITVDGFIQKVKGFAGKQSKKADYRSINELTRFYSEAGIKQPDIVSAALNGEITYIYNKDPNGLLHSMFIDKHDFRAWAIGDEGMGIPDVADQLKVKQEVAYHFINKGFIACNDRGRLGRLVEPASLLKFRDDYVLARDLAEDYGTSSRKLANVLNGLDVLPVSGKSVDGGRQTLFLRSDISKVHSEIEVC